MKNIYFIINPISGGVSKDLLPELIHQNLDIRKYSPTIIFTAYPGHAKVLAVEAIANSIDIVVAVGGDGTINEIGSQLVHSSVALGIIPSGSGNGLARHMGIPLDTISAIKYLNTATISKIDVGQINDRYFFCTSGIGFDAHVSHQFAALTTRGLWGYFKLSVLSFLKYQPAKYHLEIDGKRVDYKAFLITFANASQFGNNAYIAPLAEISDGLIDVCIMRPFSALEGILVAIKLFSNTIHKTGYVTIYKAKNIILTRADEGAAHVDGEAVTMSEVLQVSILPKALNILS